jgi:hypothetical protein
MNRGHNFYAADKIYIVFESLDPPEKEACYIICAGKKTNMIPT